MRLLLDTHALIWAVAAPERLPGEVAEILVDPANEVVVSVASAWEVAIKRSLGKLVFPNVTPALLDRYRFTPLPIDLHHTVAVAGLPDLHRDPFDRMLVAQARTEQLVLVTHDEQVTAYGIDVLW